MEKQLQVVMRDAASIRREFTWMSLTNKQKKALEGSTVFHETELGSFVEDSDAAGLDTALLAQVKNERLSDLSSWKEKVENKCPQAHTNKYMYEVSM